MFQGSLQNVSKNLHVAVSVTRKAASFLDHVFIDHTQTAKSHVRRIVIIAKRKGVISIEPTEIEVAAVFCFANFDHRIPTVRHPSGSSEQELSKVYRTLECADSP